MKYISKAVWMGSVEKDGAEFWYLALGDRGHGRPQKRIYLSSKLLQFFQDGLPERIPAVLQVTEKGTMVLKPSEEREVYFIYAYNGYRGEAEFTELPETPHIIVDTLDSELGSLGHGKLLLIELPKTKQKDIVIKYRRSGRHITTPVVSVVITKNGEVRFFEGDIDELDFIED